MCVYIFDRSINQFAFLCFRFFFLSLYFYYFFYNLNLSFTRATGDDWTAIAIHFVLSFSFSFAFSFSIPISVSFSISISLLLWFFLYATKRVDWNLSFSWCNIFSCDKLLPTFRRSPLKSPSAVFLYRYLSSFNSKSLVVTHIYTFQSN